MGYFTDGCRYCNGDESKCTCRCHSLTQEDKEFGTITCNPEEYD